MCKLKKKKKNPGRKGKILNQIPDNLVQPLKAVTKQTNKKSPKSSNKLPATSQIASNTENALMPAYLALYKKNEDGTFSNTCMQLTPIASHPFLSEELHKWRFRKPHRWESTNIKPSCFKQVSYKMSPNGICYCKGQQLKNSSVCNWGHSYIPFFLVLLLDISKKTCWILTYLPVFQKLQEYDCNSIVTIQ